MGLCELLLLEAEWSENSGPTVKCLGGLRRHLVPREGFVSEPSKFGPERGVLNHVA